MLISYESLDPCHFIAALVQIEIVTIGPLYCNASVTTFVDKRIWWSVLEFRTTKVLGGIHKGGCSFKQV